MNFDERAGRNEEVFRTINQSIDAGARMHGIDSPQRFHCECAVASCESEIYVPAADYEHVVNERYCFMVAPGHEVLEVERVVERHDGFTVVEKQGEARAQIDRAHPQERHRQ